MKKQLLKKENQILRKINKNFMNSYLFVESSLFYRNLFKDRKHVYIYPEFRKMNKIMRDFYHQPKLQLSIADNLIPFKFETDDNVVISAYQYISNPNSDKWMIVDHWVGSHKLWSLYWSRPFIELGYNIIVFDHRNHGESDQTRIISLGIYESRDLFATIKWLKNNHKYNTLALMGIGMGAYNLNYLALNESKFLKEAKVKFGVSDSMYGSVESLLQYSRSGKWGGVSKKPKNKKRSLTKMIDKFSRKSDIDWHELDIINKFNHNNDTWFPIIFTHSKDDKSAPITDTLQIAFERSRHIRNDQVKIFSFGDHSLSLRYNYEQIIANWLQFENEIMHNDKKTKAVMEYFGVENVLSKKKNAPNDKNNL